MRNTLLLFGLILLFLLPAGFATAQTPAPLYFPPTTGTAWATTTPASLGWCQPQLDSLIAFAERKHSNSLLILKDGRLVVEHYYGTYTADSVHYWASAGKSLTATLVGLAQQDGLLSLDDSTSRYLGRWTSTTRAQQRAFPNPATDVLTLRQPAGRAASVRLLDALGREARRQPAAGATETSVSVAALPAGLYVAQWLDGAGRVLTSCRVARP